MNILQNKLYVMLQDFENLCKENDVTYYLAGGSALGAVRNNGFLPWDDDIDIYITRENWEKLKKVPESAYPQNRRLVHIDNTDYYYNPIPRFVDTDSTLIYRSQVLCGKACGQHLELLIFDPLPNDEKLALEYKRKLAVYTELLSPYFVVNREMERVNSFFDKELYDEYYKRCQNEGKETVLKELENDLYYEDDDSIVDYCMRWGVTTLVYPKRYFQKPRYVQFEDKKFPVAQFAEKIFRLAYGDTWMYIPEVGEQVTHNSYSDFTTPFQKYVDDYMPRLDIDSFFKNYQEFKDTNVEIKYSATMMSKSISQMKAKLQQIEFEKSFDKNKLVELIENKDYYQALDYVKAYLNAQFDKQLISFNTLVKIDIEVVQMILNVLLIVGDFGKVIKLYRLYLFNEYYVADLQEYYDVAMDFRRISRHIYDSFDNEKLIQLLDKYESYQDYFYLEKAKLYLMSQSQDEFDFTQANHILNTFKDDGEVNKYIGDWYYHNNDIDKAKEYYTKTIKVSRNGVLLLDIYHKTQLKSPILFDSEV